MQFRFVYLLVVCWMSVMAEDLPAAEIARYRFPVKCGLPNAFVPYAATQPVDRPNPKITRIIVGIHGSGFDASKRLTALQQAAAKMKGTGETTLIVAPQFFGVNSIKERIPNGLIAWKSSLSEHRPISPVRDGCGPAAWLRNWLTANGREGRCRLLHTDTELAAPRTAYENIRASHRGMLGRDSPARNPICCSRGTASERPHQAPRTEPPCLVGVAFSFR